MAVVGSVDNMQFFVHAQELHIFKVTGQETVAWIKAHGTSLKGITLEDQVVFLADTSLKVEATLGQCRIEVLAMSSKTS